MDQSQLIHEYARCRSDDSFKALVDQYVGLVYSSCFRQLKDRHLAEDATQAVFILLSQKAGTVPPKYLSGWLLTTSRYACANIRRSQKRRERREKVLAMNPIRPTEAPDHDLLDLLDDGLGHLKSADREVLVLRYLKEQPLDDVAENLGISQAAARKRVDRGIEKLRKYFSRRGINTSSAALGPILAEQFRGTVLTADARHSIAEGILEVCRAGAQSTGAGIAIANGTKTMIIINKLETGAVFAALVAIIGAGGWMISRSLAEHSAAPGAPALVAAAPSNSPAAETPIGAPEGIDLSTPEATAHSFFHAVKIGNRAQAYACLTADPNRPANEMDAMLAWNLAQNHITEAVTRAFGGNGAEVKRIITLDQVALAVATNPDSISHAAIEGDTATIPTNIPQWMIAVVPADFQPILRAWTDKKLYFQKQGGNWKFDLDRSMKVIARIQGRDKHWFDSAGATAVMTDCAAAMDRISHSVSDGQMDTAKEAGAAMKSAFNKIHKKYGIVDSQFDIVPNDEGK